MKPESKLKGCENVARFNVLTEPWIPVERMDGSKEMLGIIDTLEQAQELHEIICRSPLETYAVKRLLMAFLMDALRPQRRADMKALFDRGSFPKEKILDYIAVCENEGTSFDLFDEKRPFMQAGYDDKLDRDKKKPVAILVHEFPSGNNHIHFDHRLQTEHRLTYAEALRALCATYVFCTAGLSGPSSVNNTPCTYILCEGDNLFQTLLLGMVCKAECGPVPYDTIPVAWRSTEKVNPKEEYADMSVLAAFTWRPRRVNLISDDEEGFVSEAYIQEGLNFLGNGCWEDPHAAYRQNKKEEWYAVKPQSGRECWRDVGMIAAAYEIKPSHKPPMAVAHYEKITGAQKALVKLNMTGLVTNKAQYLCLQCDTLSLPPVILASPEKGSLLCSEMAVIESVAGCITSAYGKLEASVASQLLTLYFSQIREALFSELLPLLAKSDSEQEDWQKPPVDALSETILKTLRNVTDEASGMYGTGAKNLVMLTRASSLCMGKSINILKKLRG